MLASTYLFKFDDRDDCLLFLNDIKSANLNSLTLTVDNITYTYSVDSPHPSTAPVIGDRVAMFYNVSEGQNLYTYSGGVSGYSGYSGISGTNAKPYMVMYVDGNTSETNYKIYALRETINPVVQQLSNNIYTLTFWSNFYETYKTSILTDGYTDDPSKMAYMGDHQPGSVTPSVSNTFRALFVAKLKFYKCIVTETGQPDWVLYYPICDKPTLIDGPLYPPLDFFASQGGFPPLALNNVIGSNNGLKITVPTGQVITVVEYKTVNGVTALNFTTACLNVT